MLYIRPIQEKEEQKTYADACGVPYRADDFAYAAFVDDTLVGISQFRVTDRFGIIDDLAHAAGTDDVEALYIMGRQTMNWIDLLGIHTCRCRDGAGPEKILRVMGFVERDPEGYLSVDTTHLFEGHCGGHCDIAKELHT